MKGGDACVMVFALPATECLRDVHVEAQLLGKKMSSSSRSVHGQENTALPLTEEGGARASKATETDMMTQGADNYQGRQKHAAG